MTDAELIEELAEALESAVKIILKCDSLAETISAVACSLEIDLKRMAEENKDDADCTKALSDLMHDADRIACLALDQEALDNLDIDKALDHYRWWSLNQLTRKAG